MPYEVLYALEDVLKIRRQYHAWYSNQFSPDSSDEDNKDIKKSNEAHHAFIGILQCIHDLFAPAKTSADQARPSTSSEEKILEITNRFANLEAETVAEEEAGAPMTSPSSGSEQAVKPRMARKPQAFIEDKLLELYCLYEDANKIRDYLSTKWSEYACRMIDIQTAALTTQGALEMFASIEESYEEKYGTILENNPGDHVAKFVDIFCHLAIGEPLLSSCTKESWASKTAAEKEAATLQAQSVDEDRRQRTAYSEWTPSEDLDNWVMRPAVVALHNICGKGEDWVLKQACRTTADRAGDLDALLVHKNLEPSFETAARELLETFIDFYAGMIFVKHNPMGFMGPYDIITLLWLQPYDHTIRMTLCMQVLHDIRTAGPKVELGDPLTQASEDYKRLAADAAILSRFLDGGPQNPIPGSQFLKEKAEKERSWLQGKFPGHINQPGNKSNQWSQRMSELPLLMNPVLEGVYVFEMLFRRYRGLMADENEKWFLIPSAHLVNWLAVTDRKAKADFQKVWPDFHTALGMIGPRPIWVGSGQPQDSRTCRNRMLLAWGLPLVEFYQRMTTGNVPTADELFNRIKNNRVNRIHMSDEQIEGLLGGTMLPSEVVKELESKERPSPHLKIETSQSTPLLHAISENLKESDMILAQGSNIRKIVLASTTTITGGPGSTAKASGGGGKRKAREEPDMILYLDAFSLVLQAETPRLIFPYDDLALQCCGLLSALFGAARGAFDLSAKINGCDTMVELEGMTKMDTEKLGSGAQSVCSLLALAVMFSGRNTSSPVESKMLSFIEDEWDKEPLIPPRHSLTESFVEECREFGFVIPECAIEALSSGQPARQT